MPVGLFVGCCNTDEERQELGEHSFSVVETGQNQCPFDGCSGDPIMLWAATNDRGKIARLGLSCSSHPLDTTHGAYTTGKVWTQIKMCEKSVRGRTKTCNIWKEHCPRHPRVSTTTCDPGSDSRRQDGEGSGMETANGGGSLTVSDW